VTTYVVSGRSESTGTSVTSTPDQDCSAQRTLGLTASPRSNDRRSNFSEKSSRMVVVTGTCVLSAPGIVSTSSGAVSSTGPPEGGACLAHEANAATAPSATTAPSLRAGFPSGRPLAQELHQDRLLQMHAILGLVQHD